MSGDAPILHCTTPRDLFDNSTLDTSSSNMFGDYVFHMTVIDSIANDRDWYATPPPLAQSAPAVPWFPPPLQAMDLDFPVSLPDEPSSCFDGNQSLCPDSPPYIADEPDIFSGSPLTATSDSLPSTGEWEAIPLPPLPPTPPPSPSLSGETSFFYLDHPLPAILPEDPQRNAYDRPARKHKRRPIKSSSKVDSKAKSRKSKRDDDDDDDDDDSYGSEPQNESQDSLRPIINQETKAWSCPTCGRDFGGQYEAQRHISEAARCTGTKVKCVYCGHHINPSTYSKKRHLKSKKCKDKRVWTGADNLDYRDIFVRIV